MKQHDESEEEEATTVCQDFSDLFSLSLSLSSPLPFDRSVGETIFSANGKREKELIIERVKSKKAKSLKSEDVIRS